MEYQDWFLKGGHTLRTGQLPVIRGVAGRAPEALPDQAGSLQLSILSIQPELRYGVDWLLSRENFREFGGPAGESESASANSQFRMRAASP